MHQGSTQLPEPWTKSK